MPHLSRSFSSVLENHCGMNMKNTIFFFFLQFLIYRVAGLDFWTTIAIQRSVHREKITNVIVKPIDLSPHSESK